MKQECDWLRARLIGGEFSKYDDARPPQEALAALTAVWEAVAGFPVSEGLRKRREAVKDLLASDDPSLPPRISMRWLNTFTDSEVPDESTLFQI